MTYVVFDTKAESVYKDEIEKKYHFPSRYLESASSALGSWVIYREPRADGGRMAYFAVARLDRIEPDRDKSGHYYAYVGDFTEFDREVPWQSKIGEYREQWLRDIPQSQVGVQMRGKSVKSLESRDFLEIVNTGLYDTFDEIGSDSPPPGEQVDLERKTKSALMNQKVRERSFRRNVTRAYSGICAFTGLSIVDSKGNSEVEAAHIRGVEHDGPDITTNGIALSRTAHWLFDRFLVSLSGDLGLLYKPSLLPSSIVELIEPQRKKIILPRNKNFYPALRFVQFHRQMYEQRNR